jgi:Tol biopolymer transport system component/predicted Ser/Thr protein kinase
LALTPGSQLGPYEIASLIGAGGMGEVYRARDKRLDRVVAIKVLPASLSERPDLRQRLEREARTISGLSHANICTLYDVGETPDGAAFLVMEYLEGESLADRLLRGPLPLRQAQRYGAEMAEALDRAHRQGIVHRDLKPANVMITKSGVKLLDFGLARVVQSDSVFSDADSPTAHQERDGLTAEGTIVGTLQYMSPEQLEGKAADARSDIFAFGATLYEMLTGRRPFQASSRAGLIASILHEDPPPVAALAPSVPPPVVRLVDHCLMKDPDDRWQTARDVAIQLRGMLESSGSSEVVAAPADTHRRRLLIRTVAGGIALLLLGAAGMWGWQRLRGGTRPAPGAFSHMSISLSPLDELALAPDAEVAVSPDGTRIAVIAQERQKRQMVYVRSLSAFPFTPVAGTEGATSVFFSPDGTEIGFTAAGGILRVSLSGGTPEKVADAGPSPGGSWGSDGLIVYNPMPGSQLHRVAAGGGATTPLTKLDARSGGHSQPAYFPRLDLLLYVSEIDGRSFDEAEIVALSLSSGESRVVARGTSPRYVASTGDLVFGRANKIWKVPFDAEAKTTRGTPTVIVDPALVIPGNGVAVYDVTPDGALIYAPYDAARLQKRLMLVDRSGSAEPLRFPAQAYETPRLAANGRQLMVEVMGANNDVWVGDMVRGTMNRITSISENLSPIPSPDGSQLIVSLYRGDAPKLNILRTDGGAPPRPIAQGPLPRFASSWSADGSTIAFMEFAPSNSDIHLLRMNAGEQTVPLLRSRFGEFCPALTGDGQWMAYVSDETGTDEVYVRSTAPVATKIRVSTHGGREPLFSPDGRELFFLSGDSMMVSRITVSPELGATTPTRLFDFPSSVRDISRSYDITPDGQHFVMIERAAGAETMRVLNVIRF